MLVGHCARAGCSVMLRAVVGFALASLALAGCGVDGSIGSLNIDPGKYDNYRCNDLVARWKIMDAREKELANLMAKASQSGAGAVIGTMTYRTEYENLQTEEKMVQRDAAEKKCELVATFQSDQSIH